MMTALERLKIRLDEPVDEALLSVLLDSAASAILARRYPYGDGSEPLEKRYEDLQVRIAADLYAKLGGEGQLSHTENGVSRSWAAANISPDWLAEIVPTVGGIR